MFYRNEIALELTKHTEIYYHHDVLLQSSAHQQVISWALRQYIHRRRITQPQIPRHRFIRQPPLVNIQPVAQVHIVR